MQYIPNNICQAVAEYLNANKFDSSHDINHATRVAVNCADIINVGNYDLGADKTIVITAGFVHDMVDSKYVDDAAQTIVRRVLETHFDASACDDILQIINNISYSKRIARRAAGLKMIDMATARLQLMTEIVCDADMLDAYDPQRCIDYGINKLGLGADVHKHVKKILSERVLLYRDNFFNTTAGRELSLPLHDELAVYVLTHL